jgi:hypothetical protein
LKLDQLKRLSQLSASATKLGDLILDSAKSIESQFRLPKLEIYDFKPSDGENNNKTYRDLVRAILRSSPESRMTAGEIISKAKEEFPESTGDADIEVMSCKALVLTL